MGSISFSPRASRYVGLSVLGVVTLFSSAALSLKLQPPSRGTLPPFSQVCTTFVTDPKPPLNIRSSPVVAKDNVIHRLANGSRVTVIDDQLGWLRIAAPVNGWVAKSLTVTSCVAPQALTPQISTAQISTPQNVNPQAQGAIPASTANPASKKYQGIQTPIAAKAAKISPFAHRPDVGVAMLARAAQLYHDGNLPGAIALAQTIPAQSDAHGAAQLAIAQWQVDWKAAQATLTAAQVATQVGQWQQVISQATQVPDNRFWREQLTPLVRQAMVQLMQSERES
jgi:hypothetical protein